MNISQWTQVEALFQEAVTRPLEERTTYIEAHCNDPDVVAAVHALLRAHGTDHSLLDAGAPELAAAMLGALPQPETIGAYRVTGVLGRGGGGVVYDAEHATLGHAVAIKVLPDAALAPHRTRRFLQEQQLLARLRHPNIAQLFEAGALPDGTPYFVMEKVEGVPITTYCASEQFTVAERLRLMVTVCETVQYAHEQAIIHRDIKPANVLVTRTGAVKLLDFGIARRMDAFAQDEERTRTGLRMMTPAYAAPEQLGGGPVGTFTDTYALGVLLYELLTGERPLTIEGNSPAEMERIIWEEQPLPPSTRVASGNPGGAGLSKRDRADLDVLCLKALRKEPERRYTTAEALARDIERFLRHEPLSARPDSRRYRLRKFVRRNRNALTVTGLIVSFIAAGLVFHTMQLTTARDAAVAEAERTARVQQVLVGLFEGGDPAVGPASDLTVLEILDRGLQQAPALASLPDLHADLNHTLGTLYHRLGNLPVADSLVQEALSAREQLYGRAHADVAASLIALGEVRRDQAELEDAKALLREALQLAETTTASGHPLRWQAATALGTTLQAAGDYAASLTLLNEALALQQAQNAPEADQLVTLRELANTQFYAGSYGSTDSLSQLLLSRSEALYGRAHPAVADALINLGAVRFERGDYAGADSFYQEALSRTVAYFGESHHRTAAALTMRGRALLFQGELEAAEINLERTLAITEQLFGADHPRVASIANELGTLALQRDRPAEAEAHYRRALAIYEAVYDEPHYLKGIALSNIASAHLADTAYEAADRIFREAIQLFESTLGVDHLQTAIAQVKLGRALMGLLRLEEAVATLEQGHAVLAAQEPEPAAWLTASRHLLADAYEAVGAHDKALAVRPDPAP